MKSYRSRSRHLVLMDNKGIKHLVRFIEFKLCSIVWQIHNSEFSGFFYHLQGCPISVLIYFVRTYPRIPIKHSNLEIIEAATPFGIYKCTGITLVWTTQYTDVSTFYTFWFENLRFLFLLHRRFTYTSWEWIKHLLRPKQTFEQLKVTSHKYYYKHRKLHICSTEVNCLGYHDS